MREKEGVKMGGKEEKRGACRGESLIICLPSFPPFLLVVLTIYLFFTTHLLMSGGRCGDEKDGTERDKRNKEQHHRIKEEEMELDHIALIVSKEENLAFYKKLGFVEKNRIERGYDTVVFMECDELLLEVFIDPNHPARVSGPEALGLRHIAFVVESLEEVMRDVECEEIRTDWFGRRFTFTKDPDGQPIELKEKK